jgi:hypothetical protein
VREGATNVGFPLIFSNGCARPIAIGDFAVQPTIAKDRTTLHLSP